MKDVTIWGNGNEEAKVGHDNKYFFCGSRDTLG
jgi:hypothetical protein